MMFWLYDLGVFISLVHLYGEGSETQILRIFFILACPRVKNNLGENRHAVYLITG